MSMLHLRSDYPHNHISVPRVFIDTYMADANGEFVKVYLFLLRCMGSSGTSDCSISAIADHFNYTEKDILRALKYWEKVGVLSLELNNKNQLVGLCFKDLTSNGSHGASDSIALTTENKPVSATNGANSLVSTENSARVTVSPKKDADASNKKKPSYTLDEIKAFNSNSELKELLFVIETYLNKPLTSAEMNTIFYWYDSFKFSTEVIEYLVEYCITNGHSSLRYMDKVALGWSENGIDSIEKAKEHVSIRSKAYYSIMKAFGISGRNLADSEVSYVNKWTKEFSFDIEIIQEACKRTISATQKPSFEYADSILTNWHKQNIHTIKDIAASDEAFNKSKRTTSPVKTTGVKNNKFNNFEQRNYDFEKLEKMLLTSSMQ